MEDCLVFYIAHIHAQGLTSQLVSLRRATLLCDCSMDTLGVAAFLIAECYSSEIEEHQCASSPQLRRISVPHG